jgi:putative tryptophan/tyrosine transport system substrate-binding protein
MHRLAVALISLALLAAPLALEAQPAKVWRIGLLCANFCDSRSASQPIPMPDFRRALQQAGYVDGDNLLIDYRGAGVSDNQLPRMAAALVREKADIIVAAGSSTAVSAARQATTTTPIVMAVSDDADESGDVDRLSRPGGNVTGLSVPLGELVSKQMQLLKEAFPALAAVAVLSNPSNPAHARVQKRLDAAARSMALTLLHVGVSTPAGFETAFTQLRRARLGAVLVLPDPLLARGEIMLFALRNRLPSMFTFSSPVASAGGLMAYGPSLPHLYERAAD